jgi:alkylated DNA nucleotide flippase Atl1
MNIHEFCQRFKVSQRKAREMEKAGVLTLDPVDVDSVADIRGALLRGNPLSALMLVRLVEDPALFELIGGAPGQRAKAAVNDLAFVIAAPDALIASIPEAAYGKPEAVELLASWIKSMLPTGKLVTHPYIAVRLLKGTPAHMREDMARKINSALGHVRRSGALDGWWRVVKADGRPVTLYQRPQHDL